METIDFLRNVKHIRPTTEKIYNSVRKELIDKLDILKYKTNKDYLIDKGIVEVRGEGERDSVSGVRKNQVNIPYQKQIYRRKCRRHKKNTETLKL